MNDTANADLEKRLAALEKNRARNAPATPRHSPVLALIVILLIVAGGHLVLTSPYTWLEEFTPREKWLGGRKVDGENVTTLDGLQAALGPRFTPVGEPRDVPFVIRETARKFQHTVAQLTVWQRSR